MSRREGIVLGGVGSRNGRGCCCLCATEKDGGGLLLDSCSLLKFCGS
jgi:hypothetical protein